MEFWNFSHHTLGLHVYIVLVIILALVMTVIALIHDRKQKNRDEDNEDELAGLKKQLEGSPASEAPEAEAVPAKPEEGEL